MVYYFLSALTIIIFLLFFRDLFPRCPICKKTGVRFRFRRLKAPLDYSCTPPVCISCSKKYDIDSPSKYRQTLEAKRKIELNVKSGLFLKNRL